MCKITHKSLYLQISPNLKKQYALRLETNTRKIKSNTDKYIGEQQLKYLLSTPKMRYALYRTDVILYRRSYVDIKNRLSNPSGQAAYKQIFVLKKLILL